MGVWVGVCVGGCVRGTEDSLRGGVTVDDGGAGRVRGGRGARRTVCAGERERQTDRRIMIDSKREKN